MRSLQEVRRILAYGGQSRITVLEGFNEQLGEGPLMCKKDIYLRPIRNRWKWWCDDRVQTLVGQRGALRKDGTGPDDLLGFLRWEQHRPGLSKGRIGTEG